MDGIKFTLTYSALKMFGKQLYSNVSSAISELVANGLDAKAPNIYLTIDIRDKMNSMSKSLTKEKECLPQILRITTSK